MVWGWILSNGVENLVLLVLGPPFNIIRETSDWQQLYFSE